MTHARRTAVRRLLALAIAASFAAPPAFGEDWYPSRWGAEDEIGAANRLSPEGVLAAAKLVKTGKTYALGIELNSRTPAYPPRVWTLIVIQPFQQAGTTLGPTKTTYNDDLIQGWTGIGSQIDGPGHVGIDGVYYNGNKAADFAAPTGLTKLGIEKVPPIVARGVLLDIAGLKGVDMLPDGAAIGPAEMAAAAKRQGVEVREGDVVLLHTGWMNLIGVDNDRFGAGEPGLNLAGARYLAAKGIVAVGADQWGVEVVPFEEGTGTFEVHQELLAKNGIYLLENMDTRALARDRAYEFMFVLGQPKFTGAVQGMINPIAIR